MDWTEPQPTSLTPDFRVYPPEIDTKDNGEVVTFQVCETLIDGRWEGYVTILGRKREGRVLGKLPEDITERLGG